MFLDPTAKTSLPVDYMENISIHSYAFEVFLIPPISQKNQTLSVPQVHVTGFPEKGICPPISPELLFAKGDEQPTGNNISIFPHCFPQQAFKLKLEGSGHERNGSTQSNINNLLLCKMLT